MLRYKVSSSVIVHYTGFFCVKHKSINMIKRTLVES